MRIGRSARDWRVDGSLTLVAVAVGVLMMLLVASEDPPPGDRYVVVDGTVGALACVALLLFRRRWPVALAVALLPTVLTWSGTYGAVCVTLFTVAVRRPWWLATTIAGVHATLLSLLFRLAVDDPNEYVPAITAAIAIDVALVASGMLVRSQRRLVDSLRERARQAEEGQRLRAEEARHLERERIAREMHDVLAHRISLLAVQAGALEVRRDAPDDERAAAGVIRAAAYAALEDLRTVVGMLRAGPDGAAGDRPQPTTADVAALVEEARQAGARVVMDNRAGDLSAVPDGVGRHAYRVVQEGLTNARKHGHDDEVRVTLAGGPGRGLTVEVVNAVPLPATSAIPGTGTGLVGLRERMDLIGGRVEHGPTPDGDFRLRAHLPWPP